ncbi:MAG: Glycosyltransferase [Phormidesmis priestleyi Ana]|uniref:Glycosyltransferase n=1 Tax=Phormidesmis priestleyi Ana TaxID=1666911 RepID=A0A0P8C282_9CYAN|nr:MAG: Glycosyltransferase [Phormidesmis priestleyi Ana]
MHTLELAQALTEAGHEVCVFALDKDGQGFHRAVGFSTCAVPARACYGGTDDLIKQRIGEFVDFFEAFFEQRAKNEESGYDIYHAQDCLSANALAILKRRGLLSHFVRTVHHIEAFKSPYLQDCQEKSIYQSDRCLCVSELWQQVLQRDYGITAHRVINGVSARFSMQPNRTEIGLAKAYGITGAPIYLTVGGIEPRKNSINLLKAFRLVTDQQPQAQLVIAGGATLFDYQDYRREFMTLVEQYGLADAVILPGVVPDEAMPVLYRLANAFVFPSLKEGWGLVLLEAIASGLPVLTANQAPFTEFLSSDSAQLVDPTVVEAIASGMIEITKPEVARRLISGSQPVVERYSWQRSAQMHLELYQELSQATPRSLPTL